MEEREATVRAVAAEAARGPEWMRGRGSAKTAVTHPPSPEEGEPTGAVGAPGEGVLADGAVLVVDSGEGAAGSELLTALQAEHSTVLPWSRLRQEGMADPPELLLEGLPSGAPRAFSEIWVRTPKSREERRMLLHLSAARARRGAPIYLFGAKDEGIGSADRELYEVAGEVYSALVKRRCRVWSGRIRATDDPEAPIRGRLEEWRIEGERELAGQARPWVSYPGVFAAGRIDPGTELLLEGLMEEGEPSSPARTLDFGCGDGIILAVLVATGQAAKDSVGLDRDALAVRAARENLPEGTSVLWADGPGALSGGAPFERIVANPPYHQGKTETLEVVERLLAAVPTLLAPGGELVLVVQERFRLDRELERRFAEVEVVGRKGPYHLLRAAD